MTFWGWAASRVLLALAIAVSVSVAAQPSRADYPDKPIRLIVPFPAGGTVDIVARLTAARLAQELGSSFVIENKGGAGGVLATDATAKAAPDGYTLLLTTPNHTINAVLNPKLPYDTEKDLVPVAIVAAIPMLFVSHPSAPFDSFRGFVDYAKAHPDKLNYASAGNGTLPHIVTELMLKRLSIRVTHIPYRGAAPAMTDLLAGQVQLKMDTYATAAQHIAAGKLRALAYTNLKRSAQMPDVPTVAELGLGGYEGILWMGLVAPAGTPKPIIDKLAAATARAVQSPEFVARLQQDGIDPVGNTPDEFGKLISREIAQWRDVIAAARITAD